LFALDVNGRKADGAGTPSGAGAACYPAFPASIHELLPIRVSGVPLPARQYRQPSLLLLLPHTVRWCSLLFFAPGLLLQRADRCLSFISLPSPASLFSALRRGLFATPALYLLLNKRVNGYRHRP
jgi:hypothetical protein